MKYLHTFLIIAILIASCSGDKTPAMEVSGTVKGLKKGTLYLQKVEDSALVTLDSITLRGNGDFGFSTTIESPEIFYLYLKKEDQNEVNDRITFFGEPGKITIKTVWNAFDSKAVIEGSSTQKELEEYREVMTRFNTENLEQLKAANDPEIINDAAALDSLQKANERSIRRSYLYTLNYAMSHTGSHIAPFIAITEVPDANSKYLDSLYNSLEPQVANGKYGKALKSLLEKRSAE
ncbi:DUF4369 domain-containing protein [Muriicola marianensis]|uniref:DUF4369 domain-containing protein n=1 Tax=Muriicola marianensis TaxID=1324801 RepID=A0ABQ1QU25_9FLAO|nr:DUF4369 domain-containing protein [Muriicola marianensis]GGD43857.1 hypothetical protein GCM10011361_08520 [Muriicola marianensis]